MNALARAMATDGELLDLTVSLPGHPQVGIAAADEALGAALGAEGIAGYRPAPLGLPEARAAVAAHLAARHGVEVSSEAIVLTASSSESYSFLFKLLCDPGDVVLVPTPSYPLFEDLARLEGVATRAYPLAFDGAWHVDFGRLDVRGARALVVVSPNNPTGSFVARADWQRLDALAADAGAAVVVDEVFADYPLSPGADALPTVLAATPRALTFVLGGLSKSCALPQLKLGWMVARGPAPQVAEALARLDLIADTYLSVGTPVQLALPRLLAIGAGLRERVQARVVRNRAALAAALGPRSPCTLLPTEAGWSALLRVPAALDDEAWALLLLERDRVLVHPGYLFDLPGGTFLVLSLLPDPARFDEGVRRLLGRIAAVCG
jgi:aspartate/methionine/tyrosine aminotransferase